MTSSLIVVTVGTDHHPFDRLVGWVDRWFANHGRSDTNCVIQHGTSFAPEHAEGTPYLDAGDLASLLDEATVVVSHGGPSTLMEVRGAGLLPLVLPRDPALGEHVDGHQQAFAAHMHTYGRVDLLQDEAGLCAALDLAVAEPERYQIDSMTADADLDEFTRLVDQLLDPVTETTKRSPFSGLRSPLPVRR